jgi:hypothetical protein
MLSVIDGYNVCIFAYGQTGSGKTFTMIGARDLTTALTSSPNGNECHELAGITPRAVAEIFRLVNERQAQCTAQVTVQMFQLYRDGLEDLLQGVNRKRGVVTAGAGGGAGGGEPTKRGGMNSNGQLKITLAEHSPTGLVHVSALLSSHLLSSPLFLFPLPILACCPADSVRWKEQSQS